MVVQQWAKFYSNMLVTLETTIGLNANIYLHLY